MPEVRSSWKEVELGKLEGAVARELWMTFRVKLVSNFGYFNYNIL